MKKRRELTAFFYNFYNIKKSLLLLFLLCAVQDSAAAGAFLTHRWRLGINPVALPSGCNINDDLKRYLPLAAGLEYGAALSAGLETGRNSFAELRLVLGKPNRLAFVPQLHLGHAWFPWHSNRSGGFYLGPFIKLWDYYNSATEIHFFNLAPYAAFGWQFTAGRWILDLRLSQTLFVFSCSTLEHSSPGIGWALSPWPDFLPVIPLLSCTVSFRL